MDDLKGDLDKSIFDDNLSSIAFSLNGDEITVTLQREIVLTVIHGGETHKLSRTESVASQYVIKVLPMHHLLVVTEDRCPGMYVLSVARETGIQTLYLNELEKKIFSSPAALRDIGEQIDKTRLHEGGISLIPSNAKYAVRVQHRSWGMVSINSVARDVDDPDYRNWFFPENT